MLREADELVSEAGHAGVRVHTAHTHQAPLHTCHHRRPPGTLWGAEPRNFTSPP